MFPNDELDRDFSLKNCLQTCVKRDLNVWSLLRQHPSTNNTLSNNIVLLFLKKRDSLASLARLIISIMKINFCIHLVSFLNI